MLDYLFLLLTLLLAFLALRMCSKAFSQRNILSLVFGLLLSGFVFLYGAWVYLSVYIKFIFALGVLLCLIFGLLKGSRKPAWNLGSRPIILGILIALGILFDVSYFTGIRFSGVPTVELGFPLGKGNYFVLQGGKGLPSNIFHYTSRGSDYAMDLVKLDPFGRRCRGVFSNRLQDYFIYGDTIYCPCDGKVLRAVRDNPDNKPPERKRGPHNLNGVLIESPDYFVFLGHLQPRQVFVQAGQIVHLGQPLGLVGNSGMSLEPHLHIQVHQKLNDSLSWYRHPQLFIHFNGKGYLLFETFHSEKHP